MEKKNASFYTLLSVFFFWGFVAASTGIFIPFCKSHFNLSQFQSQLIDSAFYGAYFLGSVVLWLASQASKIDILNKFGYKKGIIYGLIISIVGALALVPSVKMEEIKPISTETAVIANLTTGQKIVTSDKSFTFERMTGDTICLSTKNLAYSQDTDLEQVLLTPLNNIASGKLYTSLLLKSSLPKVVEQLHTKYNQTITYGYFPLILLGFFIIALGFSLQQTAAQPFVIALGSPETGAHRLNLAGGINSFGTLLGPIMVSWMLFGDLSDAAKDNATIYSISTLFIFLAGVFALAAILLGLAKLPNVNSNEAFEPGLGALKFPQLRWGMLAIFTYVGVEVAIQSNMGALLKLPDFGGYDESQIAPFISLYWGSLMIGRWTGAISAFNFSKPLKNILTVVIPFIAFALILYINTVRGSDMSNFRIYAFCVGILILGFFMAKEKPARTLLIFGLMGIVAMLIGLFNTGQLSVMAFICGGLCCSIMWPCIFSLSIMGLGKYAGQGSAFLVMMILGGAIIPPLQGLLADQFSIISSYWITVACFAYLAFFAWKVNRILKSQGIYNDTTVISGH
jgi:fucose permease